MLLGLGGVLFVPFGLAVWARIRQAQASPLLAGLAVIATTLVALTTLASAGTYGVLGDIGGQPGVSPAALQAWHIMGSEGSLADGASTFLFLLTAALAGLAARAVPRWLAWPALLLAVLSLVPGPFGFLASMVFLAWTAAAGITLLVARQPRPQLTSRHRPCERGPSCVSPSRSPSRPRPRPSPPRRHHRGQRGAGSQPRRLRYRILPGHVRFGHARAG